jgi:predicted enzyme related to lactoylglutathione lyase
MHRSRLCALMIDCHNATMESGVQFWSQALGLTARQENAASPYVALTGNSGELQLHLQRIGEPSRLHLDIEADDVEAEVQRLEQLGSAPPCPDTDVVDHGGSQWSLLLCRAGTKSRLRGAGQRVGYGGNLRHAVAR